MDVFTLMGIVGVAKKLNQEMKGTPKIDFQERMDEKYKIIELVVDEELEAKYWSRINNPAYYDEVWCVIEKFNRRFRPGSPLWGKVGEERYRFFNGRGQPTKEYLGNRQLALRMLMSMHEKEYSFLGVRKAGTLTDRFTEWEWIGNSKIIQGRMGKNGEFTKHPVPVLQQIYSARSNQNDPDFVAARHEIIKTLL